MRRNIKEQSGWLIDLYEDKDEGLVLWFLSDRGERLRLHKRFVRTFFIDGDRKQLQRLQQVIKRIASPYNKVKLFFTERRSVFHEATPARAGSGGG
jgi:IS1 family transposase